MKLLIRASKEFVDMGTGLKYWYFTTHGVQPGSIPKGLDILEIRDTPNGSYFLTDKVITTNALRDYDIKERSPREIESSSKVPGGRYYEPGVEESYESETENYPWLEYENLPFDLRVGDVIKYDSNYSGVTPRIHKGKILSISKGVATHDDPNPGKIYKVKDELGRVYKIDEAAIL